MSFDGPHLNKANLCLVSPSLQRNAHGSIIPNVNVELLSKHRSRARLCFLASSANPESSRPNLQTTAMASTDAVKVPFFKKGKSRPTTSRKRSPSPGNSLGVSHSHNPAASQSEVVHPSKKSASNLLSAGTKRTATQREIDDIDAPEKDGPDVKWTASGSHVNAALDILAGDEAEELLAKRRKKEKADAGEEDEEVPDDGQYRGQNAYRSHIKKSSEVPKAMRVGPQRSTSTIRTVTIVDYQPDVCKDYKGEFHNASAVQIV